MIFKLNALQKIKMSFSDLGKFSRMISRWRSEKGGGSSATKTSTDVNIDIEGNE